jgi:hypothetical protein
VGGILRFFIGKEKKRRNEETETQIKKKQRNISRKEQRNGVIQRYRDDTQIEKRL